jgi:hypothetical protein
MGRYVIRVYSDREKENSTLPGTVVTPTDLQLSFYTDSADDAEKRIHRDTRNGMLPKGRVYQICPPVGSFEPIRSCAIAPDGSTQRVFLDPVDGLYGETRRIRLPRAAVTEDAPAQLELELNTQ